MNELTRPESRKPRVDLSEFTPDEQILAKLYLARKGRNGLQSRYSHLIRAIANQKSREEHQTAIEGLRSLNEPISRYELELQEEVAERLGISPERVQYIRDYIIDHETEM